MRTIKDLIKDLIKELKKYDQDLPVTVTYSFINHVCGDGQYCYCSSQEEETGFYVSQRLDNKKKLTGVTLVTT